MAQVSDGREPLCVEPGCDRPTTARGLCNQHYKQHRRAGTLPAKRSLADRLWSRVTMGEGCWTWTGPVNRAGWGYISDQGHMHLVHRVAYDLLVGPLVDGEVVRRRCGNSLCVRPDHLE